MSWAAFAIVSAALSAVVAIFDSHILSHRLPDVRTYFLPLGVFHMTVALVILVLNPFPADTQLLPVLAAFGSGILAGGSSLIMLNVVRGGEISRIIPVINTSPIFVALISVGLLGETLGYLNWIGVVVTVAGAILISVQTDGAGKNARLQKSFLALILSSLLFALSNIATKYASDTLTFWSIYAANAIMVALAFLLPSARPSTLKQLAAVPRRWHVLGLIVGGQAVVVVAILLSVVAIQKGQVALAATAMGARPAFVFVYTLVLSRFFPNVLSEKRSASIIALKVAAIVLIVGGVALLTL